MLAEFEGVEYRGSIVRMGGQHVLGMPRAIQNEVGKTHGDQVTVSVERDHSERDVDLPAELANLLEADLVARNAFQALSYSHRQEHANYVAEAKKPETRKRRAEKTVESLRS